MQPYDKDYARVFVNLIEGDLAGLVKENVSRIGGMKSPLLAMTLDLAKVATREKLYNWKNQPITNITDTWLDKVKKIGLHELEHFEPIAVSTFRQALAKDVALPLAIAQSISGTRPTLSERDKELAGVTHKIYSLRGQQQELYEYLGSLLKPHEAIEHFNEVVTDVLSADIVPDDVREEWTQELIINEDRLKENRLDNYQNASLNEHQVRRNRKWLLNLGVKPVGIWENTSNLQKETLWSFYKERKTLNNKEKDPDKSLSKPEQLKRIRFNQASSAISKSLSVSKKEIPQEQKNKIYERVVKIASDTLERYGNDSK